MSSNARSLWRRPHPAAATGRRRCASARAPGSAACGGGAIDRRISHPGIRSPSSACSVACVVTEDLEVERQALGGHRQQRRVGGAPAAAGALVVQAGTPRSGGTAGAPPAATAPRRRGSPSAPGRSGRARWASGAGRTRSRGRGGRRARARRRTERRPAFERQARRHAHRAVRRARCRRGATSAARMPHDFEQLEHVQRVARRIRQLAWLHSSSVSPVRPRPGQAPRDANAGGWGSIHSRSGQTRGCRYWTGPVGI